MSPPDLAKATIIPQILLRDASSQNYTNRDSLFPGLYNETM